VAALPKSFNQTRFLQNFLTVLNDTKDIEKCTPMSIARTAIKGAYLGLDFFRRECYAIVYGDQCNFQTDYKGEIKLCKKYSPQPIHDIYAKLVREGDNFEMRIENGKQIVNFSPKEFNDAPIVGAFAIVYYEDGSMICDSMSKAEIEDTRQKYSKIPNGPAWTKSWGEQAKKTVLRRLCKLVDLDFDYVEQDQAFEEGADIKLPEQKEEKVKVSDPFAEQAKNEAQSVVEEAVIVDPDSALKVELRKKFPSDEEWQIVARIKESREAK
jgi:recombination protein RecT